MTRSTTHRRPTPPHTTVCSLSMVFHAQPRPLCLGPYSLSTSLMQVGTASFEEPACLCNHQRPAQRPIANGVCEACQQTSKIDHDVSCLCSFRRSLSSIPDCPKPSSLTCVRRVNESRHHEVPEHLNCSSMSTIFTVHNLKPRHSSRLQQRRHRPRPARASSLSASSRAVVV